MSTKMQFDSNVVNRCYSLYRGFLEKINEAGDKLTHSLIDLEHETNFTNLVKLTDATIEFYNQDVRGIIKNTLMEWCNDSKGNITGLLESVGQEGSVLELARTTEKQLVSFVDNWPKVFNDKPSGEYVNMLPEEHKAKVNTAIGKFRDEIVNLYNATNTTIEAEPNILFGQIQAVIGTTYGAVMKGFESQVGGGYDDVFRQYEEDAAAGRQAAEAAHQRFKLKAGTESEKKAEERVRFKIKN